MQGYTSASELFSYRGDIQHARVRICRPTYFQFATLSVTREAREIAKAPGPQFFDSDGFI